MSKDNGTEYVFFVPGKGPRFEIVFERKEAYAFAQMHGAAGFLPSHVWERAQANYERGEYIPGDQPFQCPRCGTRTEPTPDGKERCTLDGLEFTLSKVSAP